MDAELAAAAAALAGARRVLVITGAGMSADAGLPTYRGIGGLYEQDLTEDGLPIEEALSGAMLRARPALTWKYLAQIEQACRGVQPHAGHRALALMQSVIPQLSVLTQNIDGLHQAAGQREVIEIHGRLHALRCDSCGAAPAVSSFAELSGLPPACPACGESLRPQVVLFGEALPAAAIERLEQVLARGVDAVMSIGTTSVFPYIAAPVVQAARLGLPTIEINPGETEVSGVVRHRVRQRAIDALPALLHRLQGR
ncbi:MAG TPA: NAD-dependent protein deacylase [Nevskiaceae bacterium]|nr:NAD-dependent protein deacylase [Nevskiaceae bacterium]